MATLCLAMERQVDKTHVKQRADPQTPHTDRSAASLRRETHRNDLSTLGGHSLDTRERESATKTLHIKLVTPYSLPNRGEY